MRNAAAMLYCPNPNCQAANSENHQFCQKCSTPLPYRYLWGVGEGATAYQAGEMVVERYLCKQPRIFLDTKPGLLSNTYQEPSEGLLPYLRLTSYPLHVPELYDWIPGAAADLILLDRVPLDLASEPQKQLLPTLASQWQQSSPLRQLNWLWQITTLWQPLSSENVVATLFDPELLRVEGTLLRLLELRLTAQQPTLSDLGQLWLQWVKLAKPEIAEFLSKLCQGLIQGQIHNAELLLNHLDQGLAQLSQAQMRSVEVATLSDQGPTRARNEDACYPPSGTQTAAADQALLIVCDGIGGHQGGDVASQLAITTLETQLKALDLAHLDSITLSIELEKAVGAANDQISARNDNEHRFDRQRMGTTVVMALARAHELYIAHVGDSRAYWINRYGCHQITLDDDVASREVRLGYSFYRQALHQPSAGSLVQALGMGTSTMLYPTVQRFIPDEDTVLLLCSDGLSDNDQVEAAWQEIASLLDGKTSLNAVSQRLVEIGNTRNGYDNVTVGLIYYRVSLMQPFPTLTALPLPLSAAQPTVQLTAQPTSQPTAQSATLLEAQPTELAAPGGFLPTTAPPEPRQAAKSNLLLLLVSIGMLIGIGGLLIALLPALRSGLDVTNLPESPAPSSSMAPTVSPIQPTISATAGATTPLVLEAGSLIQFTSPSNVPLVLVSQPPGQSVASRNPASNSPPVSASASPSASPAPSPVLVGQIVTGSVLEVLRKQSLSQQESWVELRVCATTEAIPGSTSSPSPISSPTVAPLRAGQTGWIREATILPQVVSKPNMTASQRQSCL